MTDRPDLALEEMGSQTSAEPTAEYLSPKNLLARELVSRLTSQYREVRSSRRSAQVPGSPILLDHLSEYEKRISEAHAYFSKAVHSSLNLTYASEWILDNFYVIRQAIRQVREDLPAGYYKQLPQLSGSDLNGLPRIYAIARQTLSANHNEVDEDLLEHVVVGFQEEISLHMGEIWALPIFLRLAAVETLAHVLTHILPGKDHHSLPIPLPAPVDNPDQSVANSILSLRTLSEIDWKDFFERTSTIEQSLRTDPGGVYSIMDFETRNLYRREIERLALLTGIDESRITTEALSLARQFQSSGNGSGPARQAHVGYYLIDHGRTLLEERLQVQLPAGASIESFIKQHAQVTYITAVIVLAISMIVLFSLYGLSHPHWPGWELLLPILLLVPGLGVSTSLVNWAVTRLLPPGLLPKLEFSQKERRSGEIPPEHSALVVIPCLLTGKDEIDRQVQHLEMHYLRNPDPNLYFGLLSDFSDASEEVRTEDSMLEHYALQAVQSLNKRYPHPDGTSRFTLFHRKRTWNPVEGTWMGWERKRGKLHELNRLLRGQNGLTFTQPEAIPVALRGVRYVITLDADTILPTGAAARLIGTMAHPLNQAEFSADGLSITSGYSILQPRMEISPTSGNRSMFTRIFAGDTGLDLYSRAVSDAYQDLLGEGIYVGKGIYEIDAFERSISNSIPENSLLSHDLLEGLLGRAGLVTDITMVEDYPPNYLVHSQRQHRWIRGDWQLLPWLLAPKRFSTRLSPIDLWKIIDNLRRSLLAPSVLLLIVLGVLVLPGSPWVWILAALLAPGIPLLTSLAQSASELTRKSVPSSSALRPARYAFMRWMLALAYLPHEAHLALDAILATLYRVFVSRKNLLEWTTAAQAAAQFRKNNADYVHLIEMGPTFLFGLVILALGVLVRPHALAPLFPVLVLWLLSPWIVRWLNRPLDHQVETLGPDEARRLRAIARRTWSFFEQFAGPQDHWLPPDHFQESPLGVAAHRTSPSNIGLMLTSTLAAYDLGYLDLLGLVARLTATFDTLESLDRYRGHFLNWYDTVSLQPLHPRYVSTVDSGNLAACFIVTAQACQELEKANIFRWENWEGYLDTLHILEETLHQLILPGVTIPVLPILSRLQMLQSHIIEVKDQPERWYRLYRQTVIKTWPELANSIAGIIQAGTAREAGTQTWSMESLRALRQIAAQVESHHLAVDRTIRELSPWISLLEEPPVILQQEPGLAEYYQLIRANVSYRPVLSAVNGYLDKVNAILEAMRSRLGHLTLALEEKAQVEEWIDRLSRGLLSSSSTASVLTDGLRRVQQESRRYVREVEFQWLYHPDRRIFHIGYNLDAGLLDSNFYDLLASEARIASVIAIAKGEVPQNHWVYLNRPVTHLDGMRVLLSWSATMFEYLMPPLFLRTYPGTLLEESARGAVEYQIQYAREKGVPWGISESGFFRFDSNQSYQYRAFGVPGLGFKRGLGDDLVVAPYASLMAAPFFPREVHDNVKGLVDLGMQGLYGFFESVDFTRDRLGLGVKHEVVKEYMAHHQGMILLGIVNLLRNHIMVTRMHSEPIIRSVELLLQEQVPLGAPNQIPESEEVKGTLRTASAPVDLFPWAVPVQTPGPQVHLLSNGSYAVLLDNAGGGYSRWNDLDLTRWQSDSVIASGGTWIYLQEIASSSESNAIWSAGTLPIPGSSRQMQVTYHPHMAVYRRDENEIVSTLEVSVASEDPLEIRRLHVTNNSSRARRLRVTSYGEVILAPQATDARHPAFNKMFIESEYLPDLNLLIFRRRKRSSKEKPAWMGHMLVRPEQINGRAPEESAQFETDRYAFIGRGQDLRRPAALVDASPREGSAGATLDPIFSLTQQFDLHPHESIRLSYLTFAAASRDEIIEIAARYRMESRIERAFHQANLANQSWLGQHNTGSRELQLILQALSAVLYPTVSSRAPAETLSTNNLGQSGLWRFGISGDYPIILVNVHNPEQVDLVRELLNTHRFLRSRRFFIDLVIVNQQHSNYGAELNGMLYRLASRTNSDQWLNQRGGIFILLADQMRPEERTLIETSARLVLDGEKGSLSAQVPGYSVQILHLPELGTTRPPMGSATQEGLPESLQLLFPNGYGGFSPDGREYIIDMPPGKWTPAPWSNVIGYPGFGFLVTESGSSCTWAVNSGENRLTPWSNDPVSDPSGEALYLRDEETGEVWTPTPLPAGENTPYRARHGAGYTIFENYSHGLRQELSLFAAPDAPVKIIRLRVRNRLDTPRRITATQYVEWVLGTTRPAHRLFIVPEHDPSRGCLLAANRYNTEFGERVAFLAGSRAIHGLTADRAEFIGRNGSLAYPAALRRIGLENRVTPGEDQCGVLQVHIDLPPGGEDEVYFLLGQGDHREHALELVDRFQNPAQVEATWRSVGEYWDNLLGSVQVRTPDPALDLMLNRWLLYQALSCRIWGRSAFFQSSGAYGFRDQLQDVMSLLPTSPEIARAHILESAAHQFEAGDVLHWWHPPSGRGVRTRFSDDLLWLPYVVSQYVETTGDIDILSEQVAFVEGPALKEDEEERYGEYPRTQATASLFEHCRRAVEKGATSGRHRLPLIGTGDWNDGMNRIGVEGKGESVWLAWFLFDVFQRFARLCDLTTSSPTAEEAVLAKRIRSHASRLAEAIELEAWDGHWYRRAYFDDGTPLGSAGNEECKIDSIAQSWGVISGAARPERARQAMESVLRHLVRPDDRLLLLFTPPFDQTPLDPGYIKGYLPGIRENGGQYTHAAIWTAWAMAMRGEGEVAGRLAQLLNPVYQADTAEKADVYRVEPYVIAADIYSVQPYIRRGGWTWYTGSSGWMYRLLLEALLGLRKQGDVLWLEPAIPPEWDGFEMDYRHGSSLYRMVVRNPNHRSGGVTSIRLNGKPLDANAIPLMDDGTNHSVEIIL